MELFDLFLMISGNLTKSNRTDETIKQKEELLKIYYILIQKCVKKALNIEYYNILTYHMSCVNDYYYKPYTK
jgi:hypothetical protein